MATVVITATVVAVAIAAIVSSNRSIDQRRDVLTPATDATARLYRALIDQQTGSRGYVITGSDAFLEPYERGVDDERRAVVLLRASFAQDDDLDAALSPLLQRVDEAARAWREASAQAQIDLVASGRRDEAVALVDSGDGQRRFEELRRHLDVLDAALTERSDAANRLADERVRVLGFVAVGGTLLVAGLSVGLTVVLRRWLRRPLDRLATAAGEVAAGHLDAPITAGGPAEIDSVARSVDRMRHRLLGEINAAFSKGLVEADQIERARLAAELHDDPIQVLVSAQWRLQALEHDLDGEARAIVQRVTAALADVQLRLRDLMFRLHPPALESDGLRAALDDLLDESFVGTGVDVELRYDLDVEPPPALAALAYRLSAEAVRNVQRHADASRVRVSVRGGDGVRVTVSDDGVGFAGAPPAEPGHRGVDIGATLAEAAGGWWRIESRPVLAAPGEPGHGTTVAFWLPPLAGAAPS